MFNIECKSDGSYAVYPADSNCFELPLNAKKPKPLATGVKDEVVVFEFCEQKYLYVPEYCNTDHSGVYVYHYLPATVVNV